MVPVDIPSWVQTFVLVGIAFVILVVPVRVLYAMTKTSRDRLRRVRDLADRLRERFTEVSVERRLLGPHRIKFKSEGRSLSAALPEDDVLEVRLDPRLAPAFPLVARTRGTLTPSVAFEGFRMLPRMRTFDPLIDDTVAIYATGAFAGYVREAALAGLPAGGKPQGIAESLLILRRLPGIRHFELRMSRGGGFRVRFDLRSEDLIYRPDELEAAVHHFFRLYEQLVES